MSVGITLSSRHQIVIPKEARDALHLKPGKRVMDKVQGNAIIMLPQPDDPMKALRGLHKKLWQATGSGDYPRKERDSGEPTRRPEGQ